MRQNFFLVLLALIALAMPGVDALGQLSTYSYGASTATPTDMTGSTVVIGQGSDDETSSVLPIGFTFRFGGSDHTEFVAGTNGLLFLGGSSSTSADNSEFGTESATYPLIAPFWDDLRTSTAGTQVEYVVTGTAPDRVLTVQWIADRVDTEDGSPYTFQARLYEGTNIVEYVYVSMPDINSTMGTIGLAASWTDFISVTPSAGASSVTPNNEVDLYVEGTPIADGTSYVFSPACPTITSEPTSTAVCDGASATFTVVAEGTGPFTYQWRFEGVDIAGANSDSYTIDAVQASDAGSYDVAVMGLCSTSTISNAATLSLNEPVSIVSEPTDIVVCSEEMATFSVEASGTGELGYQWRFNGADIPNANSPTYSIAAPQSTDAGSYDVVVTDNCGSTTSNAATLSFSEPVEITVQPVGTTICEGEGTTLTVEATGSTLTYQWRHEGVDIEGATDASYSIPAAMVADGGSYDVLVSGACESSMTSDAVVVTVNQAPQFSEQPTSQTVCENTEATFTVNATGTDLTYQWRKDGIDIDGATSSIYTIASAQITDAGSYDVVVSGTCAPSITSEAVSLTVYTAPVITREPADIAACENSPATFSVMATGTGFGIPEGPELVAVVPDGPLVYQWRKDGIDIEGANEATYTIPSVQTGDAGVYDVIVNGQCAPADTSNGATLTVQYAPVITDVTPGATVCENTPYTFTVNATGTDLTYQWQKDGIDIDGATASTYEIPSVQTTDAGDYSVTVSGACSPSAVSSTSTLTIQRATAITTQPVGMTICEGQTATFSVESNGTETSYQWRRNGVNIAGATSPSYTINGVTPANAGDYTVAVSGSCAPATVISDVATLVVGTNPRIVQQPVGSTVCRTFPVTFTTVATGTNLTYQWRRNGVNIPGARSASYTIPQVMIQSAGNYDVVISGSCGSPVTSSVAVLVVNVEPTLFKWTEAQTRTPGQPVTFSVIATGTAPITYQWYKGNTPIPGATQSSYSIASVQAGDAGVYAVEVANKCMFETSGGMFLFVNTGTNEMAMPADLTVCSGQPARFTAPGSTDQFSYQWRRDGNDIAGATSPVLEFASARLADAGTYTVKITDKPTGASMVTAPAALSVTQGTQISRQPQSLQLCHGAALVLSVDAAGNGLAYQWRKNGIEIPGATAARYELPQAISSNAGNYDVVISGGCGEPLVSQAASVSVLAPTAISQQPEGRSIARGHSVTFNVVAAGENLSYQWRRNGETIAGATQPSYTIASAVESDGGSYDVEIIDGCGVARISDVAVLTVDGTTAVPGGPSIASGVKMVVMPHPAHGATRVEITLPQGVVIDAKSVLSLYDMQGNRVLDLVASTSGGSSATAEFNAADLASGNYNVRLESKGFSGAIGSIVVRK